MILIGILLIVLAIKKEYEPMLLLPIGAADGPASIFAATRFAKDYIGPISVAAYSYMALEPLIQPPAIAALATRQERIGAAEEPLSYGLRNQLRIYFPGSVLPFRQALAPEQGRLKRLTRDDRASIVFQNGCRH
jgi:Na+-transporting methylmalonyl-CoA/oxaloacetate decarboxylase beta subunit